MTVLDDHFGVVETDPAKEQFLAQAKLLTTNWGNAPVRLRKTLDQFQETAGFVPGPWLTARWRAGAQVWVNEFGENATELLVKAVVFMRQQQPPWIIKSPQSCITAAYDIQNRTDPASEEGRHKYLNGLED